MDNIYNEEYVVVFVHIYIHRNNNKKKVHRIFNVRVVSFVAVCCFKIVVCDKYIL